MMLVLLETQESYLQIRVQSLCTLGNHCRQRSRNIRYQAGATPYSRGGLQEPTAEVDCLRFAQA